MKITCHLINTVMMREKYSFIGCHWIYGYSSLGVSKSCKTRQASGFTWFYFKGLSLQGLIVYWYWYLNLYRCWVPFTNQWLICIIPAVINFQIHMLHSWQKSRHLIQEFSPLTWSAPTSWRCSSCTRILRRTESLTWSSCYIENVGHLPLA